MEQAWTTLGCGHTSGYRRVLVLKGGGSLLHLALKLGLWALNTLLSFKDSGWPHVLNPHEGLGRNRSTCFDILPTTEQE